MGTEQGLRWPFPGVLFIIPILTWIWTVLPQESTGAILHGICHRDGVKVAMSSSNFLLPYPKRAGERDVAMNLTHHPFLGEVEWAEGGPAARALS